jgi:predicted acylesterase/phospholipase RssA
MQDKYKFHSTPTLMSLLLAKRKRGGTAADNPPPSQNIFACLSGGGFRAALYQLGALKRLYELGLLPSVQFYAATSGGSILAAAIALHSGTNYNNPVDEWNAVQKTVLDLASKGVLRLPAWLLRVFLLYLLAAVSWTADWAVASTFFLAVGLTSHLALLQHLRAASRKIGREKGETQEAIQASGQAQTHRLWTNAQLARLLFSPSGLRREALNLMAFKGNTLSSVSTVPAIFITTMDLVDGKEKIFSPSGLLEELDESGIRKLWWKRGYSTGNKASEVPLAAVVAASSAIPPLFKPVRIGGHGVFIDGGVTDNLAMNLPKAFAAVIHGSDTGQNWYRPQWTFSDLVKLVLIIDGSQPTVPRPNKRFWTQLSVLRVLDAISNNAVADAGTAAKNFERNCGIETYAIGLKYSFTKMLDRDGGEKIRAICRNVRTHLDAFTPEECAFLMYCGYEAVEGMTQSPLFERFPGYKYIAPGRPSEMLPHPQFAKLPHDLDELVEHMAASNSLLRPWRFLRRKFNF